MLLTVYLSVQKEKTDGFKKATPLLSTIIKDLDYKIDGTPKVEYIASSLTIVSVTKNLKIWLLLSHFGNIIYLLPAKPFL